MTDGWTDRHLKKWKTLDTLQNGFVFNSKLPRKTTSNLEVGLPRERRKKKKQENDFGDRSKMTEKNFLT